ncbi:MAG: GerW family sporulation protein [Lachnospiraceae bacterium]|nr:GerW family sporulation protein [Lachnospiraceae bacterium]
MSENFKSTLESLFKGMDSFISSKTVVGEAIHIGDTIILPLVDVSFGVGAGAFGKDRQDGAGGGIGGKLTPSAVLVISNGNTKLVRIKNPDSITKIIEMVPEIIDKVKDVKGKKNIENADSTALEEAKEELTKKLDEAVNLSDEYEA